ncbi:hypothetical protein J0910_02800 [Nocardiopsis sp. CNT-189]|uniref:hypothetical protein n=1 Tax=Nocardiopsis oceanisediminis TaxID=2816862 RepID=UPI003B38F107
MDSPLVMSRDRFPTGLPGRRIPLSDDAATAGRPWGMDRAVTPVRAAAADGRHERPTENRVETRPTQHNVDNKVEPDTQTVTVTD